jgi:nitrate/nitrite-specific signal transduction histidine kinase
LRLEEEFHLPKESAIHLYRIAQEAVNCLLKTGEVSRISIEAFLADSTPTLIVTGEGVAIGELSQEGAGLMYSRAKMIGAEIRFEKNSARERAIVCSFSKRPEPAGA